MSSIGTRYTVCLSVGAEYSKRQGLCVSQMGLYRLSLATVSPEVRLARAPGRARLGNVCKNPFLRPLSPSGLSSGTAQGVSPRSPSHLMGSQRLLHLPL